jgi:chemotaxis protein MotB
VRPADTLRPLLALALLAGATGCVKKSTHQTALDELARTRVEQRDLRTEMQARLDECRAEMAAAVAEHEAATRDLQSRLDRTQEELEQTERRRQDAEDRFEEARTEVHRIETVLSQRGTEYQRLEQRLRSLAAIEREVQQRNRIYEEVIGRFRSLIDAGKLTVAIERGRMVIKLPQDILFTSGSASLGEDGRSTLGEVAAALADFDDRTFQVEGHTDNVPIATERFPSNWELSTARALSVVRLLVAQGVSPDNLSGAGYGEFQPAASNADAESRRRNRRIEIVMLPNLDVIAAAQVPGGS